MKKLMISKIAFAMALATLGQNINGATLDTNDIKKLAYAVGNKIANTTLSDISSAAWGSKKYTAAGVLAFAVVLTQINATYNAVDLGKELFAKRDLTGQEIINAITANVKLKAEKSIDSILKNNDDIEIKANSIKGLIIQDKDLKDTLKAILDTKKRDFVNKINPKNWELKQAADFRGWNVFTSIQNSSKSAWNVVKTIFGGESYAEKIADLENSNTVLTKEANDVKSGLIPALNLDKQTPQQLIAMAIALDVDAKTLTELTSDENLKKDSLNISRKNAIDELKESIKAVVNSFPKAFTAYDAAQKAV